MSDGVVTHACTTILDVDALSEVQCRKELKELQAKAFGKDLLIIDLKTAAAKLDGHLIRLLDLFIAENYSKLHAVMKPMAEHLQEVRAAQITAKRRAH
jgi:hypothetical protein